MTLAKSLANGLPAGAVLVSRPRWRRVIAPGDHGSTFGGGPVDRGRGARDASTALRGARARRQRVPGRASYLRARPHGPGRAHAGLVTEVRGRGLMNAIEFSAPLAPALVEHGSRSRTGAERHRTAYSAVPPAARLRQRSGRPADRTCSTASCPTRPSGRGRAGRVAETAAASKGRLMTTLAGRDLLTLGDWTSAEVAPACSSAPRR